MKANRNDPCPCGSGKKYKNCHEGRGESRSKMTVAIVALVVLAGLVIGGMTFMGSDAEGPPDKVWSEEHGHWH